jgi:FKBP-type peptidyl-prolyl cis-trans isomerase 2
LLSTFNLYRYTTGTVVETVTELAFETGNEVIPAGLEEAVNRMKKGETAEVAVPAAHAYGAAGKGDVPADADVVFTVTMMMFEKEKEVYTMVGGGGTQGVDILT